MANTDEAPSFIQAALAETVHREHTEHIDNRGNKHTHARFHQRRAHVHDAHLHERQDAAQPTVTAVVQTVSVVRQVAVDGDGNTISVSNATYTANTAITTDNENARATAAPAAPAPTEEAVADGATASPSPAGDSGGDSASAAPSVPDPVSTDTPSATSEPEPTQPPPSTIIPTDVPTEIPTSTVEPALPESTTTALPDTVLPSTASDTALPNTTAAPLPPSDVPIFSSLTPVNGTAAGKSSHGVSAFASLYNNTASSHTMTGATATSALYKNGVSIYYSVYTDAYGNVLTSTIYSTSGTRTGTGTGAVYGTPTAGTGTGTGSGSGTDTGTGSSSSDAALGASNDDSNDPPPTPVVVGSVVGSLAGVTLLAFLVMLLLRWKRRQQGSVQLGSGRDLASPDIASGAAAAGPMAMIRRASIFTVPAALASLTGQNRKSQATNSSAADSHRSFVRVSGRKLPSVLTSGGNGYEDPFSDRPQDPFADPHLSNTSFYRDSRGFYGGTGYPASPTSAGLPSSPLNDRAPPRSPATGTGPLISFNASPPLPMPDALGRSHPSRDGSRNSRFTEEV
ncbi:hypothetical protein VE03_06735 [Pseudogymnoascus sp. 23342-1-I1]|nr:hypothetical protein VE03_06735 [Pseudogymnoascus sp. 23342-1-I1]